MSRTIRIDREVHAWLEAHARGHGDTPNRTLRRIIGLDLDHRTDTGDQDAADTADTINPHPPVTV